MWHVEISQIAMCRQAQVGAQCSHLQKVWENCWVKNLTLRWTWRPLDTPLRVRSNESVNNQSHTLSSVRNIPFDDIRIIIFFGPCNPHTCRILSLDRVFRHIQYHLAPASIIDLKNNRISSVVGPFVHKLAKSKDRRTKNPVRHFPSLFFTKTLVFLPGDEVVQ